MITKVIAHNFQSHAHTEVKLGKGLTVFVGDSDQGKTALVKRALLWCLFNEPSGNTMVRYKDNGKINANGERERETLCYVTIEFNYGENILTRKREKNKNTYTLINEDGEILSFEGFRDIVPNEIQEALGIKKFKIDEDLKFNINIIGSRDPSIVDLSGSVKSKVIGAFAGTNIVDIANRGVVSDQKTLTLSLKSCEKDIEELNKEASRFDNIEKRENLLNDIDTQIAAQEKSFEKEEKLIACCDKIINNENETKKVLSVISQETNLEKQQDIIFEIEDSISDLETVLEQRNKIVSYFNKVQKNNNDTLKMNKIISTESEVQKNEERLIFLEKEIQTIRELLIKKEKLVSILTKFVNNKAYLDKAYKVIQSEDKLIIYEKKLSNIQDFIEKQKNKMSENEETKKKIQKAFQMYQKNIASTKEISFQIKTNEENLKADIDAYVETVKSVGTCPVCHHKISAKELENIKNEF